METYLKMSHWDFTEGLCLSEIFNSCSELSSLDLVFLAEINFQEGGVVIIKNQEDFTVTFWAEDEFYQSSYDSYRVEEHVTIPLSGNEELYNFLISGSWMI